MRELETSDFLGHTGVRVAESCVKQSTASRVDEKIIYVVQGQAWKVQFAGDIGVLDTLQNKADNKTFYGSKNLIPCDLCAITTLQSSITAKVSANTPMLRSAEIRGNHHLDLFESDE